MAKLQIISDQDFIVPIIREAIEAKQKRVEIGVRKTEQIIRNFEKTYNISSDKFLVDCAAEDLAGGDEDYISWMGELKIREALLEELQALHAIEYIAE